MVNINNKIVGTYEDFIFKGYTVSGDATTQRGYISPEQNTNEEILKTPVYLVEKGRRSGQMFILMPSHTSTKHCWRIYLKKIRHLSPTTLVKERQI